MQERLTHVDHAVGRAITARRAACPRAVHIHSARPRGSARGAAPAKEPVAVREEAPRECFVRSARRVVRRCSRWCKLWHARAEGGGLPSAALPVRLHVALGRAAHPPVTGAPRRSSAAEASAALRCVAWTAGKRHEYLAAGGTAGLLLIQPAPRSQ